MSDTANTPSDDTPQVLLEHYLKQLREHWRSDNGLKTVSLVGAAETTVLAACIGRALTYRLAANESGRGRGFKS
jgi:hypothetical protein